MVAKAVVTGVHLRAMAVVTGVELAVLVIKAIRSVWVWVAAVPVVTPAPGVVVVALYRSR